MLLGMAAHGGHRAHLNRIQHRRDGTHIVAAQQQPQQPDKMLRLPMGLPQHIMELFQGRQENFPQLVQNLGLPAIAGVFTLQRHFLQPLLQTDGFQKIIKRQHLLPKGGCPAEVLPKLLQRRQEGASGRIQRFQTAAAVGAPFLAQAVGMVFPLGKPGAAPDAPEEGIVFHPVAGVGVHAGQGRAEIPEDTALVEITEGGIQRRQHRGNDALLQNLLRAGLVDGDVHPMENQVHQGQVFRHIGADQGNIPVAAARIHQPPDGMCRGHDLIPCRIALADPKAVFSPAKGNRPLE